MTPARFDLMRLMRGELEHERRVPKGYANYPVGQSRLWKALGLHPSTISKMVTRLIAMGWLWRDPERPLDDRRTWTLYLTPGGTRAIERAMGIVERKRTHWKHFERHFGGRTNMQRAIQMLEYYWLATHEIARSFGDTALLLYISGPLVGR